MLWHWSPTEDDEIDRRGFTEGDRHLESTADEIRGDSKFSEVALLLEPCRSLPRTEVSMSTATNDAREGTEAPSMQPKTGLSELDTWWLPLTFL